MFVHSVGGRGFREERAISIDRTSVYISECPSPKHKRYGEPTTTDFAKCDNDDEKTIYFESNEP